MMKKVISFVVLFLVVAMIATFVNAMTSSELADKLYEMGKPYGLKVSDKARIKKYLDSVDLTDELANELIAKAQEMIDTMKKEGVTDYTKLSEAKKEEVKNIAISAAESAGLTVTFKNNGSNRKPSIVIKKGSKVLDELPYDPDTDEILLADTGSNTNIVLVVSSIAVVALVAGIAVKKFANA